LKVYDLFPRIFRNKEYSINEEKGLNMKQQISTFTKKLQQLEESGVVINPWLAGMDSTGRFDPGVFERLDLEAREYSAIKWTESEKNCYFDTMPVPQAFPNIALYETFASTAVFIAHEQTGNLLVDEKIALEAIDKVNKFRNSPRKGKTCLQQLFTGRTYYILTGTNN
jgi:hypothetical protein